MKLGWNVQILKADPRQYCIIFIINNYNFCNSGRTIKSPTGLTLKYFAYSTRVEPCHSYIQTDTNTGKYRDAYAYLPKVYFIEQDYYSDLVDGQASIWMEFQRSCKSKQEFINNEFINNTVR